MKNILCLYICSLLSFGTFSVYARHIKVIVASQNAYKVVSVNKSFQQKFPHDIIECIGHESVSLVPEQPIGTDVALQGAHNRIQSLPQEVVNDAQYVVAIENYIEKYLGSDGWCDRGLIVVQDLMQQSNEVVQTSQPTFIPDEYVRLAQELSKKVSESGYSVTIGQVIQQSFVDRAIDAHDWHREIEFGGISRQQLLQDALYKALHADELAILKRHLGKHRDFPKPDILFLDFLPILQNAQALQTCIQVLAGRYNANNIDIIVGLESRGFLLGVALAHKLGIGFVPVRKSGKLPGKIHSVEYTKEYGTDTLTLAQGAIQQNQRILIVDDVIATGGSARAAIKLVRMAGGNPVEFVTLLQVPELVQQAKLDIPAFNLLD